ncbi:hypothetical protein D3C79_930510 [compost metagenome]
MTLTREEKIDYLNANTHHLVTDYEADGNTCAMVMVELRPSVESALIELGKDETWIDVNRVETKDGKYEIDISDVGFQLCGAKYWHVDHGFLAQRLNL